MPDDDLICSICGEPATNLDDNDITYCDNCIQNTLIKESHDYYADHHLLSCRILCGY
jgi:hypothetical protein